MDEWYGQVAPREKLLKYGAAVLTDAELLAIFFAYGYSWDACDEDG